MVVTPNVQFNGGTLPYHRPLPPVVRPGGFIN
jgi:hypothetical protein